MVALTVSDSNGERNSLQVSPLHRICSVQSSVDTALALFLYSWNVGGGSLPHTTLILLSRGPLSFLWTLRNPKRGVGCRGWNCFCRIRHGKQAALLLYFAECQICVSFKRSFYWNGLSSWWEGQWEGMGVSSLCCIYNQPFSLTNFLVLIKPVNLFVCQEVTAIPTSCGAEHPGEVKASSHETTEASDVVFKGTIAFVV